MSDSDDSIVDEVVGEFLVESYESLDQLDQDLVALEEAASAETLASIFRTLHTIKGTCGFLGFGRLEGVTHAAENLLSLLRDGELEVSSEIATALLRTVDAVRTMLGAIETTGTDGTDDHSALVEELNRLQAPEGVPVEQELAEAAVVEEDEDLEGADEPVRRVGELLVESAQVSAEEVELAVASQALGDGRRIGEILVEHGAASEEAVSEALTQQAEQRSAVSDSTIRVDVRLLDDLMNLVGELVLARNQILQLASTESNESLVVPSQRLNLITTELQEGVMRTRMQPIGNVWNKFPRVVRDLARACGKQVLVQMDGADTELDKTIVEAIKDPLTHLVRNSVDHGIELPEVRKAAGKSESGRLLLRAFHGGGQVVIEITDDGAGIDVEKVKAKALERGLVTAAQAEALSQRELVNLVFLPGFSTAESVTNVSGRGVGMDVVRTNIERIGGSLDIHTERGQGTTFRVKIPLTLAIIPALVVGCGSERFAIPQVSLLELVRIEGERVRNEIEWIHGAPVHRLRGRLLPVVDLASELGVESTPLAERSVVSLVVLQADGRRFGLVVDTITDTQEIVVKPLGNQVKDIHTFAGATIMGDGRVALILDVLGLAQRAHVVSESRDQEMVEGEEAFESHGADETETVLVVDLGAGHRAAVALSAVARLEQVDRSTVEVSSRGALVQYRGELLPLFALSKLAGFGSPKPITAGEGSLEVVVWAGPEGQVGLVVDGIIDIVSERITRAAEVNGRSSAVSVIAGQVTDVLDVATLVAPVLHSGSVAELTPVGL